MPDLLCISLDTLRPRPIPQKCVLCLGNFDGLHLGHQALFRRAIEVRGNIPFAEAGVFFFREPSTDFLSSDPPPHLTDTDEKLRLCRNYGMSFAILADFPSLRDLTPAEFAQKILRDTCRCVAAVCGYNYRFGKSGAGDANVLPVLLGAPVAVEKEVRVEGETVSSTRIRALLRDGDVYKACKLLSRPYSFASRVLHGKALGGVLGFPTVNLLFPPHRLIPRHGVYVTDCSFDGKTYRAVTNVGIRPTVETGAEVNCESHLLDFSGDLYGKEVRIAFLAFLRPEQRFSSQEELVAQIRSDIISAQQYR